MGKHPFSHINGDTRIVSDLHLAHSKILDFSPERVAYMEENGIDTWDEAALQLWNNSVGENDTVLDLGDLVWGSKAFETIKHMQGKHKFLIRGNHDGGSYAKYSRVGFELVTGVNLFINGHAFKCNEGEIPKHCHCLILDIEGKRVLFSHFLCFNPPHFDLQKFQPEILFLEQLYKDMECDVLIHGHVHEWGQYLPNTRCVCVSHFALEHGRFPTIREVLSDDYQVQDKYVDVPEQEIVEKKKEAKEEAVTDMDDQINVILNERTIEDEVLRDLWEKTQVNLAKKAEQIIQHNQHVATVHSMYQEKLNTSRGEILQYEEENALLRTENNKLQQSIKGFDDLVGKLQEKAADAMGELTNRKEKESMLTDEVLELRARLQETSTSKTDLKMTLSTEREQLQRLRGEKDGVISGLTERIFKEKEEVRNLRDHAETVQNKLDDAHTRRSSLEKDVKDLRIRSMELESQVEELSHECDMLRDENAAQLSTISSYRALEDKATIVRRKRKEKCARLEQAAVELQLENDRLLAILATVPAFRKQMDDSSLRLVVPKLHGKRVASLRNVLDMPNPEEPSREMLFWVPNEVFVEARRFQTEHFPPSTPVHFLNPLLLKINRIWREKTDRRIATNKTTTVRRRRSEELPKPSLQIGAVCDTINLRNRLLQYNSMPAAEKQKLVIDAVVTASHHKTQATRSTVIDMPDITVLKKQAYLQGVRLMGEYAGAFSEKLGQQITNLSGTFIEEMHRLRLPVAATSMSQEFVSELILASRKEREKVRSSFIEALQSGQYAAQQHSISDDEFDSDTD
ncbi:hypothetical protein PCE1_003139 [Barthelona sp. PCE]